MYAFFSLAYWGSVDILILYLLLLALYLGRILGGVPSSGSGLALRSESRGQANFVTGLSFLAA